MADLGDHDPDLGDHDRPILLITMPPIPVITMGRRAQQVKAAGLLGLTTRQVRRLCRALERSGPGGLASRRRGRPSNRRLSPELQARVIALVREHYPDFGPKLAREKLLERHDLGIGRETLRKWMAAAGIWLPRRERIRRAHQPVVGQNQIAWPGGNLRKGPQAATPYRPRGCLRGSLRSAL
jgi:transposase